MTCFSHKWLLKFDYYVTEFGASICVVKQETVNTHTQVWMNVYCTTVPGIANLEVALQKLVQNQYNAMRINNNRQLLYSALSHPRASQSTRYFFYKIRGAMRLKYKTQAPYFKKAPEAFPLPVVIALVPLECSNRNLQFLHGSGVLYQGENAMVPFPFQKRGIRPARPNVYIALCNICCQPYQKMPGQTFSTMGSFTCITQHTQQHFGLENPIWAFPCDQSSHCTRHYPKSNS